MRWTTYAVALLLFNAVGVIGLFLMMRFQGSLPLNPQDLPNVESRLAFNTAVSFVTNTNWQAYGGEMTMSYLSQMSGLAVQNFLSAATGMAVAIALIRGFARRVAGEIGNFWVDVTRSVLYVLLPICFVVALFFVCARRSAELRCSSPQAHDDHRPGCRPSPRDRLPPRKRSSSSAPMAAASSTRTPRTRSRTRRPSPIWLQMLLIFVIPAGLTYTFGKMVGNTKQGWAMLIVMTIALHRGVAVTTVAEQNGNPLLTTAGASPVDRDRRAFRPRRQHGRQGDPLRHHHQLALRGDHDRGLLRRGQCHARLVHPARWTRAAGQYRVGRGDLRRGRRRTLRHARLRRDRDLHRRADGRAHARIPRQEDRGRTTSRWRC